MSSPLSPSFPAPFSGQNRSGFSLVEVTMALGIISFALVALVGMLPIGLSNFRQAVETQTQAEIVQQIASEVQQANFSSLWTNNSSPFMGSFRRYYDERGTPVPTESDPAHLYTVEADRTTGAANAQLPKGSSTFLNRSIVVLNFAIKRKTAPKITNIFSVTISDNGQ